MGQEVGLTWFDYIAIAIGASLTRCWAWVCYSASN
jgi:hypothetical protein